MALREKEGLAQYKGWYDLSALGLPLPGTPLAHICENGIHYTVDVENGQKTGFFSGPEIQPPRGGRPCQGAHGAGLLYPHGLVCTERGKRRRREGDGRWT